MNTKVTESGQAGSIVRRIREDKGISRADLAKASGISPRTLFAFERGENENIGLAGFLRIASALGLVVSVDDGATTARHNADASGPGLDFAGLAWNRLGDAWKLDEVGQ